MKIDACVQNPVKGMVMISQYQKYQRLIMFAQIANSSRRSCKIQGLQNFNKVPGRPTVSNSWIACWRMP